MVGQVVGTDHAVGLSTGAAGGCCLLVLWIYLYTGAMGLPSVGACVNLLVLRGLPSVGAMGVWLHLTTSSAVGLFVYSYWSAGGAGVRTGWSEQHCYLWF